MSTDFALRKAALLVAALDDATADLLLAQMSANEADAVRRQLLQLETIDPAEQSAAIDDFFRVEPLVPVGDPPGLELGDGLPIDLAQSREGDAIGRDETPDRRPLAKLGDLDPQALVSFLEQEHPQAIAVVVARLPRQRAGEVLAALASATQTEVVRRLVDLEEPDAAVVREIERAAEQWLARQQSARQRGMGLAAVSAILNSSDATARRQILNNLAVHDRHLANRLQVPRRRFTFAELCECDLDALVRVVRATDPETAVLALAGAAPELVERLLDRLWPDEARRISKGLSVLGPTRLADIEHAQEELGRLAGQLHAHGHLPAFPTSHLTAIV